VVGFSAPYTGCLGRRGLFNSVLWRFKVIALVSVQFSVSHHGGSKQVITSSIRKRELGGTKLRLL
jgi:hypothetical protein